MGIIISTCHLIVCEIDGKEVVTDDEWESAPHFDSEEEAMAALSVDPDKWDDGESDAGFLSAMLVAADTLPGGEHAGEVVCFEHLTPLICAARGHKMGEWWTCNCTSPEMQNVRAGGPLPGHVTKGEPSRRNCDRRWCYYMENRTADGTILVREHGSTEFVPQPMPAPAVI
jgi:hypothetical protein